MQGAGDIKMNGRYEPVPQGRSISWIAERGGFEVPIAPLNRVGVPVASSRADPVRHRRRELGRKTDVHCRVAGHDFGAMQVTICRFQPLSAARLGLVKRFDHRRRRDGVAAGETWHEGHPA